MKPIYIPKGRALEYGDYALNIFDTCNHGCNYPCYARLMYERWHGKGSFDKEPEGRPGLIPALERQLATGAYAGKLIHLCFSCDPYPAPPVDTSITREVILRLKDAGCRVQILTKGGYRAQRDLDLLGVGDWFGITVTGGDEIELNVAPSYQRMKTLFDAAQRGISTWVSCEPVIDELAVYSLLAHCDYIDLFRIGKLNYAPSAIDWPAFGRECERLAKKYDRNIYLKNELRIAMGEA